MAGTATATKPEAETPSIFDEIEVETKAGTFRFRELDGESYDKCVELATKKNEAGDDITDMVQLLRWLTVKSSVDGELTAEKLHKLPFKARVKVLTAVNEQLYNTDQINAEMAAQQLRSMGWKVEAPEKKDDSGKG